MSLRGRPLDGGASAREIDSASFEDPTELRRRLTTAERLLEIRMGGSLSYDCREGESCFTLTLPAA